MVRPLALVGCVLAGSSSCLTTPASPEEPKPVNIQEQGAVGGTPSVDQGRGGETADAADTDGVSDELENCPIDANRGLQPEPDLGPNGGDFHDGAQRCRAVRPGVLQTCNAAVFSDQGCATNGLRAGAIRVNATQPIVAAQHNLVCCGYNRTSDASLLLPTSARGDTYFALGTPTCDFAPAALGIPQTIGVVAGREALTVTRGGEFALLPAIPRGAGARRDVRPNEPASHRGARGPRHRRDALRRRPAPPVLWSDDPRGRRALLRRAVPHLMAGLRWRRPSGTTPVRFAEHKVRAQ
ncbi:MAG: hypothetical protein EXR76_06585 [Myxococcales bacterium]|nr:hypothetical protein [Myxococcales bacterium]